MLRSRRCVPGQSGLTPLQCTARLSSAWAAPSDGSLFTLKVRILSNDPEILLGLSNGELEALAEGMMAPSMQARLDELIARGKEGRLSSEEAAELDRLLARADQLTLVKTRARSPRS
jgi:hypothetical protein